MVCVYCSKKTSVVNSRSQSRLNGVWRRRKCLGCGAVFSTLESPAHHLAWQVKGPSSKTTPFIEDKLFLSIYESLKHRDSALVEARQLTETVVAKINSVAHDGMIQASAIINITKVCLNRFDKVASTHYQAFHPDAD